MLSTLSKLIFYIFSRNKLRLIKFSNLFATRYRNVERIRKKMKNHLKDMIIKKLFELSD